MSAEHPVPTMTAALLLLAACGNDGGNDTVLTGFSGVLVFGIIAWVVWRYVRRKT